MTTTISKDENGQRITTTFPDGATDLAADGFGPSLIGYPNMKLSLFQVRFNANDGPEQLREIVATVQMPTAAFLEFADIVRNTLSQNKDAIRAAAAQGLQQIEKL